MFSGVYLFRGIYTDDVPDTWLVVGFVGEKWGNSHFEMQSNLPVVT